MTFSALILAVLWALQFLFLRGFYQGMKLSEIKSTGDKITGSFGDPDFYTVMDEYAFKNNIRIILMDETGTIAVHFDGFSEDANGIPQPVSRGVFPRNVFNTVQQKFSETKSNHICYLTENGSNELSQAVYASKVFDLNNNMYYLYISNAIPPIDSTISVLKTQFIIITLILFALSLITAQWISQRMSKPIIRLTKSAKRLAKGDLESEFYDDGFTEIHQLALALSYAAGELRSLDKYRREFIANISHDLKTPLTIIKFYGELIRDVSGDDPQKRIKHCDTIIKEADWLTGMVGEILELSKLESEIADVSKSDINLSLCLTETLESFWALKDKEGFNFEIDIDGNLTAFGNEPMMRRIFYNLISNAVNYTGEDKRVMISLKSTGKKVRFQVTDTGYGIPENEQSTIWDRYYKSGKTHKRAVIGTGIGLSIVKSTLMLHDAEYGVVSKDGRGSTFWFEMQS